MHYLLLLSFSLLPFFPPLSLVYPTLPFPFISRRLRFSRNSFLRRKPSFAPRLRNYPFRIPRTNWILIAKETRQFDESGIKILFDIGFFSSLHCSIVRNSMRHFLPRLKGNTNRTVIECLFKFILLRIN